MRRVLVSYSQPIRFARFDGKSVNRGLPVLDQPRALDPCRRPEESWALGTRLPDGQNSVISFVISKWLLLEPSFSNRWSRGTKTLGTRLFHHRIEVLHEKALRLRELSVLPPFRADKRFFYFSEHFQQ